MRVLFDQGTPVPLRRFLPQHEVTTAYEQDWSTLQNGELLAPAELAGFQVLVTTDTNLRYQQNLAARTIAIVVLGTTSAGKRKLLCSVFNPIPSTTAEFTPKSLHSHFCAHALAGPESKPEQNLRSTPPTQQLTVAIPRFRSRIEPAHQEFRRRRVTVRVFTRQPCGVLMTSS